MLSTTPLVRQIIYTTHSPSCLPLDLGSGVRFVEPHATTPERSTIRHDFWSIDNNRRVGATPLLFVMGAGASAFSRMRSALIAEGPSDMILLPTLIRLATGKADLAYQVVPGIAVASSEQYAELGTIAARVCYLVDGDDSGVKWAAELTERRVPKSRVKVLADRVGLEDLIDETQYLEAFSDLLPGVRTVARKDLQAGPIKSATEAWAKAEGLRAPGAIAVAEHLLGRSEAEPEIHAIKLRAGAAASLRAIDSWAIKLLK